MMLLQQYKTTSCGQCEGDNLKVQPLGLLCGEMNGVTPTEEREVLDQCCSSTRITADCSVRRPAVRKRRAAIVTVIVILVVVVVIILVLAIPRGGEKSKLSPPDVHASSHCPDGWSENQGQCYYFSKAKGNWIDSQSFCSSHGAFLLGIDPQELRSLLPYEFKPDHWIGLWKGPHQVWRWANGTEFDHGFEIRGGADCAFLDEDLKVNSSRCSAQRKWICSKLDVPS